MTRLPRTVIVLGLASLFTDLSSEMIYPLLPVFLTSVLGASAVALGLVEGIAETTASVIKIVSGIWSDRIARRKPLVLAGYGLAGVARPLIGLATVWPVVLGLRFFDRVGKGLRTSPRDALIADAVPSERRGLAFGFHRSMDHAGAVGGPLIAAALLTWAGFDLRHVFLLAFIPAIVVIVVLIVGLRELPDTSRRAPSAAGGHGAWRELGTGFHVYLLALLVFTLGNSTDAFILLRLTDAGVPAAWIAILWSLHHVVKMVSSYLGGSLSDSWGRRRVILMGWAVYAAVYLAFGLVNGTPALIAIFLIYGLYFGLTEPCEKAWASDLAPKRVRGTALGYYNGVVGIAALPASLLFGVIWEKFGVTAAFGTGAGFALMAALLLLAVPEQSRRPA